MPTNWIELVPICSDIYVPLKTVLLPSSETRERSLQDMIEEAISEGAWD